MGMEKSRWLPVALLTVLSSLAVVVLLPPVRVDIFSCPFRHTHTAEPASLKCPEVPLPAECPKTECPAAKQTSCPEVPLPAECPKTECPAAQQAKRSDVEKAQDQPIKPHMWGDDPAIFDRVMKSASSLFEWGAGGSTVAAVGMDNMRNIHTVEGDIQWVAALAQRADVQAARKDGRHLFSVVDIGPIGLWSQPSRTDGGIHPRFKAYSDQIFEDQTAHWDLIFVDGRFRAACALKAVQFIKDPKRTKILIHDYKDRSTYHVVEQFADIVEKGSQLWVFQKKSNVDEAELAAAVKRVELDKSL